MKRCVYRLFLSVVCLLLSCASFPSAAIGADSEAKALPKSITFGTLSPGTMMYGVGSGLGKVASDHSSTMVVVTPGSLAEHVINLDRTGQPNIVLTDSNNLWQAYNCKIGPEPELKGMPQKNIYPFPCRNLRSLMAGSSLTTGMLVRRDSGLNTIQELRGKRVAWGWAADPFQVTNTLACLYNGGLTIDDVKTVSINSLVLAVRALSDGRIDATNCAVGMGAVSEADAMVGVRYLKQIMSPEGIQEARRVRAAVTVIPIQPGPPGIKETTPLIASPMQIVTSTHLSDGMAYTLVKTWWTNHEQWQSIHPMLRLWTQKSFLASSSAMAVPYHDGAVKFYKEIGVWSPEMENIQAKLLSNK